ncbi:serine/threonine-protein kinase [Nocardioides pacificus]
MSGPHIPGFTCLEHLGSGGFADVFLYEQQWPRQRVAVKVVRPDVPLTEREKELFTAEADAMAQLADHPYIVSVITAGTTGPDDGGRPYLVMRYCPPPDLGVRVRATPMSVGDAVSTGIKLASAIETAHRAGILHRDIKPSNVLVTTYHEPALSDFGIAGRIADVAGDQEIRISFPWSSPELIDARSNGSVASDVYALGATIWNLLVGRSPFSVPNGDNSWTALTARILHAPPPATQRADVPAALDRLLQRCLAKDPTHRPASALELARDLQRIEAAEGFSRTPIAVEGSTPDRPRPVSTGASADDPDATLLKPATVVPSTGTGAADAGAVAAPDTGADSRRPRTGALVTAAVATTALAGVGIALLVNAGSERRPADAETSRTPTSAGTPLPVAPEAPRAAPRVEGSRAGESVTFSWRPGEPGRAEDTWEWLRVDTGASERVRSTTLRVEAVDRVCLEVRLIRGSYASPWGRRCVD